MFRDELLARADAALEEATQSGFDTRIWRMLATRARARAARGDADGATHDRNAACALVEPMIERIVDPALCAAFEANPLIAEIRKG